MVLKTLQESTSSLVWNPQSSSSRINRFCTKFSHRAFDAASERTFDYLCPLKSLLGGDTQRQSLWGVSMATEKPVYVYLSIPPLPVHQSPWRFLFFVSFFPWEKKVKFLLTTERVALYIGWWLRVNQQSVMMIIPLRERESICFGLLGRNRLAGSTEKGLSWEREGEGGRRKVNDNDIMRAIGPGAPGLLPDDYILPPSPGEEEEEREKLLSRRVYTSFRLCLIRHRKTTNQVEGMRRTLPPPLLLLLLLLFPQMIHNCYIFFSLLSLSLCFRYMCENREKCQGWDIFRPDAHSCVLAAAAPRRSIKKHNNLKKEREREHQASHLSETEWEGRPSSGSDWHRLRRMKLDDERKRRWC